MIGTCDACLLLDGDYTAKIVSWCGACKAWLCDRCYWNPFRRAQAAYARRAG